MKNNLMNMILSKRTVVALGVATLASPLVLIAEVPNVFEDGDVIYAEAMNDNFGDLDERIGAYEEAVHVTENGDVSIGASEPSAKLAFDVVGPAFFEGPGFSNYPALAVGSYRAPVTPGVPSANLGFLGLGVMHGGFSFTPNQTSTLDISFGGDGNPSENTPTHSFFSDGNMTITGALTQNSDARLKTDIEPVADALNRLMEIDGVTFTWIDESRDEAPQMGVIAQEVEAQFPELVRTASNGFKSVNYSGLVAPIIEAMQEQQSTIEDLKRQNAELEARLAAIEGMLKQH